MRDATTKQNCTEILADIAALARKLADKEPYVSVSGPHALRAFADHLQDIAGDNEAERQGLYRIEFRKKQPTVVRVKVRKKKSNN